VLWQKEFDKYNKELAGTDLLDEWKKVFTIDGKVPEAGDIVKFSDHAKTLEDIAKTNSQSFYTGQLAYVIDAYSQKTNGLIRKSDLEDYSVEWIKPITVNYRGYDVSYMPPNGQGSVVLMALQLMSGFEFSKADYGSIDTLHKQIEALKLAYTDGQAQIAQPDDMTSDINDLLSEQYADERRALIGDTALMPFKGEPSKGGTVYIATADSDGNMVSMMQSNFYGFGSGVVVPGTGIALHSRGYDFSLDPEHPNYLKPNKRPFHTIIPGFISKLEQGKPVAVGPFGVMGAYMQPQGQLQVLMNMLDFGMSPQEALNEPRWQWFGDKTVGLEEGFGSEVFDALTVKGHDIHWAKDVTSYGRGQIILKDQTDDDNHYLAGTEPRCDGEVAIER